MIGVGVSLGMFDSSSGANVTGEKETIGSPCALFVSFLIDPETLAMKEFNFPSLYKTIPLVVAKITILRIMIPINNGIWMTPFFLNFSFIKPPISKIALF
jgi:hypothetical protein